MFPEGDVVVFVSLLAVGDSILIDEGFEIDAPASRSTGVGGVTVVIGVVREFEGGVLGVVMSDGRFLLLDVASVLTFWTVAGIGGAESLELLAALREDKLPRLSLLNNPPSVFPPLSDDIDPRSGLPFCVLPIRDPGLRASFNLKPGDILRDWEPL